MPPFWMHPLLTCRLKERTANVDARAVRIVVRAASHNSGTPWCE